MFKYSLVILFCAGFLGQAGETKKDDALTKAKDAVVKQVEDLKGANFKADVVDEKYLRAVFPKHVFVAVRFSLWPVARIPPEPLKTQNVFAVSNGKVTHLADAKSLEKFFNSTLGAQLDQDKTVRSYLRLRMEFIQDGFFKFKYPDKTKVVGPGSSLTLVEGVVEVVPVAGNKGEFKAVIRFDRADKFSAVTKEENKVVRGMRPRCQATLLLHADPLVREIAEQDLLVLGRLAREYLQEQRSKAGPDLRREIDRIWKQIEAEGR